MYKLHLSVNMKIYLIFHVSLLKKYKGNSDIADASIYKLQNEEEEYEIKKIINFKIKYHWSHYLVKWKGWSNEYNEWVKEWDLNNVQKLLKAYQKTQSNQKS